MMKRTGFTFLAAMGLYFAALVLPREAPDNQVTLPLDLTGIEEVEVISPSGVGILFASAASPQLQYPVGTKHHVTVTRDGRRMRIVSDVDRYQALDIRLTPAVRKLVVPSAMIRASTGLEALDIESSGGLRWEGDATTLSINDVTPPWPAGSAGESPTGEAACAPNCGSHLEIGAGRIDHLLVTTAASRVSLTQVDTIARTTLSLGHDARFSIEQASRIPDITLLPHPADAKAPEDKIP